MQFLIVQLLGAIQLMSCIIGIFQKEKKFLLMSMILTNLCILLVYCVSNSLAGGTLTAICTIRTVVYYSHTIKDKPIPFAIFLTFALLDIIAAVLTYHGWEDIFVIVGTLIATYITYQPNMKVVRFGYVLNTIAMLTFNLLLSAYLSAISEAIFLLSTFLAINKYDIKPLIKKRRA